jgi:hypothetical protein
VGEWERGRIRAEGRNLERKGRRAGGRERESERVRDYATGSGGVGWVGGGGKGTLATGSGTVTTHTSSTNESQDASNSTAASMTHTLEFRV